MEPTQPTLAIEYWQVLVIGLVAIALNLYYENFRFYYWHYNIIVFTQYTYFGFDTAASSSCTAIGR